MKKSANYLAIEARLQSDRAVWLDAGTGTELQARGAAMNPDVWCGVAHVENPDIVRQIHIDYIHAGADVVTTNTFSSNRNMMGPAGLGDRVPVTIRQACQRAMEARDVADVKRPVLVAGSMSHQHPVKRGTDKRDPGAAPGPEAARDNFNEMAGIFAEQGVDLIILEMMSIPELATTAIDAATATGLPVWLGMCCKKAEAGHLTSYSVPDMHFDDLCRLLLDDRISAAGIMHSNISFVSEACATIQHHFDGPIMAYPDSGYFTMPDWNFVDIIEPEVFAERSGEWREQGVQILGGCCGMGVAHIEALTRHSR